MAQTSRPSSLVAGSPVGGAARNLGQEIAEEFGKELAKASMAASGKTGAEAAAFILGSIDFKSIFAKGGAHGVTDLVMSEVAKFAGIKDPVTKTLLRMMVGSTVAGAAEAGIDKMSSFFADDAKRTDAVKKAIGAVVPTKDNPTGGINMLTYDKGPGSDFAHHVVLDANGQPVPYPGQAFPRSRCHLLGVAVNEVVLRNMISRGGGGRGGGPREEIGVQLSDAGTAMRIKRVECPFCESGSHSLDTVPTAPAAAKEPGFYEKVQGIDAIRDVLAAVDRYAVSSSRSDIVRDLAADLPKLPFDGVFALFERIHPRVIPRYGADPNVVEYWELPEDAVQEFLAGLKRLGATLELPNKVEDAAHNVWEKAKRAWEHGGTLVWIPVILTVVALLLYLAAAVPIVGTYGMGLFGWWQNPYLNIIFAFSGALAALLWFIPWYSGPGLKLVFGGFYHAKMDERESPTIANTARMVTAFLFSLAVVSGVIAYSGIVFGYGTTMVRVPVALIAMALIAYDRIGAANHGSEKVHHLLEDLTVRNIRTLSLVGSVLAALAIAPLGYLQYVNATTVFPVAVSQEMVSINGANETVRYVAAPGGGAFRVEDILGRASADRAAIGRVCVPKGTDIDLPGYVEHEVEGACQAGGVGYAVRKHLFGRFLDEGAVEYASLEALYLDGYREERELSQVVEATLAEAEETTTEPVVAAPAPAPVVTTKVAPAPAKPASKTPRSAQLNCSALSPKSRAATAGCH